MAMSEATGQDSDSSALGGQVKSLLMYAWIYIPVPFALSGSWISIWSKSPACIFANQLYIGAPLDFDMCQCNAAQSFFNWQWKKGHLLITLI